MSDNQNNNLKTTLPVLIVRNQYVYPRFKATIRVGRESSLNAIRACYNKGLAKIIIVNQQDAKTENPT